MPPDPALLRRFLSRFWSPEGWRAEPPLPTGDEARLSDAGLLVAPRRVSHDEAVTWARASVARADRERIVAGFVASLGSRRLEWRSALGSLVAGRHLPDHAFVGEYACRICGAFADPVDEEDLSVLNFERHKWGGVRHTDPISIGFDLDRFAAESAAEPPEPTPGNRAILGTLLTGLRALPDEARPGDAAALLRPLLASNDAERRVLVEILGLTGILAPKGRPGFFRDYPPFAHRDPPPGGKNDWAYPVSWWRGSDVVDEEVVAFWFGASGLA